MSEVLTAKSVLAFDERKLSEVGLTKSEAAQIYSLSLRRDHMREQLSGVNRDLIALLPVATDPQMAIVLACAAEEAAVPAGYKVNVDFRLTKEQQLLVKEAKDKRAAEVHARKDDIMNELSMAGDEQKLVSYRVQVGKKKTTTTLRFEKTHTVDNVGIMAKILSAAVATKPAAVEMKVDPEVELGG